MSTGYSDGDLFAHLNLVNGQLGVDEYNMDTLTPKQYPAHQYPPQRHCPDRRQYDASGLPAVKSEDEQQHRRRGPANGIARFPRTGSDSEGSTGSGSSGRAGTRSNQKRGSETPETEDALGPKSKKPKVEEAGQRLQRSRERNRVHAQRSRMRKKFTTQALQQEVEDLRDQNARMLALLNRRATKGEVQQLMQTTKPKSSSEYADMEFDAAETKRLRCIQPLQQSRHGRGGCGCGGSGSSGGSDVSNGDSAGDPAGGGDQCGAGGFPGPQMGAEDSQLLRVLQTAKKTIVISDALLPDNPIIYASQGFYELTGYSAGEVLGHNCRFLQGPRTDPSACHRLAAGLAKGEDTSVCMLNYKKNGEAFWNQVFVAALRDQGGRVVNYVEVQSEVAAHKHQAGVVSAGLGLGLHGPEVGVGGAADYNCDHESCYESN
jgi:PAS domain S-box-containing protein